MMKVKAAGSDVAACDETYLSVSPPFADARSALISSCLKLAAHLQAANRPMQLCYRPILLSL